MSKSADAFRTISEVADWLDVPTHVLRFWESKFTQIKPVKRAGGRRYYRPKDMLIIGGIKKLLHDDGITIKGAQQIIREQGVTHLVTLSQPLDDDIASTDDAASIDEASVDAASIDADSVAVISDDITPDVAHSSKSPSHAAAAIISAPAPEPNVPDQSSQDTFAPDDDQFDLFAPHPADPAPAALQPAANLWAPQNDTPAPIIAPRYDDISRALDAAGHLRSDQITSLRPLLEQIKCARDRRLG